MNAPVSNADFYSDEFIIDPLPGYAAYLWILLITDLISLGFDYPDAVSFLRGNRRVAGRD